MYNYSLLALIVYVSIFILNFIIILLSLIPQQKTLNILNIYFYIKIKTLV